MTLSCSNYSQRVPTVGEGCWQVGVEPVAAVGGREDRRRRGCCRRRCRRTRRPGRRRASVPGDRTHRGGRCRSRGALVCARSQQPVGIHSEVLEEPRAARVSCSSNSTSTSELAPPIRLRVMRILRGEPANRDREPAAVDGVVAQQDVAWSTIGGAERDVVLVLVVEEEVAFDRAETSDGASRPARGWRRCRRWQPGAGRGSSCRQGSTASGRTGLSALPQMHQAA